MSKAPLVRIARLMFDTPLMVKPGTVEKIMTAAGDRILLEGPKMMPGDVEDEDEEVETEDSLKSGSGTRTIDISGPLVNRASGMDALCGIRSYSSIAAEFNQALADSNCTEIVLRMDSPGGECAGVFDLSDLIYDARGKKPIYACLDDMACSAGYLIASAADKVYISRTGAAGSIGVIAVHVDRSEYESKIGFKYTTIFAGEHKNDMSPHEPLSKSAKNTMQAEIDRLYDLFADTVARNRNMTASVVKATEAGVFFGAEAITAGLADSVRSFSEAIGEIQAGRTKPIVRLEAENVRLDGETIIPVAAQEPAEVIEIPAEQPEQHEENTMSNLNAQPAPEAPVAPVVAPVATAPEVAYDADGTIMSVCLAAGKDLAFYASVREQKLTLKAISDRLIAERQESEPTVRGTVTTAASTVVGFERALSQYTAQHPSVPKHQAILDVMAGNPKLYDDYLKANPKQAPNLV